MASIRSLISLSFSLNSVSSDSNFCSMPSAISNTDTAFPLLTLTSDSEASLVFDVDSPANLGNVPADGVSGLFVRGVDKPLMDVLSACVIESVGELLILEWS